MSSALGTLTFDLIAKTGNFITGLTKAEQATAKFQKASTREQKRIRAETKKTMDTFKKMSAGFALASVSATALLVNSTRKAIDDSAKMAQEVEASYSSFESVKKAAADSGIAISTVMSAGRTLNREIGKAVGGNEKVSKSFADLGLEASKLAELPLDEKIKAVNEALDKNVSSSQRASKSAEIFGSRNGQVMARLDSNTLDDATRKLDAFGLRLSEIDATMIESTNTAIDDLKLILQGVATQLTVKIAPLLQATSKLLFETAESAGGLGEAIEWAVDLAVTGFARVLDLSHTVKQGIEIITSATVSLFSGLATIVIYNVEQMTKALAILPIKAFKRANEQVVGMRKHLGALALEGAKDVVSTIDDVFTGVGAGKQFLNFYKDAQSQARFDAVLTNQARKARKNYNESISETASAHKEAVDSYQKTIEALEKEADTLGYNAEQMFAYNALTSGATDEQMEYAYSLFKTIEAFKEAEAEGKAYQNLVQELRSSEEKSIDTLKERFEVIQKSGALEAEQAELRIKASADLAKLSFAPSFENKESDRFEEAEKQLKTWHDEELTKTQKFREEFEELNSLWDKRDLELKRTYSKEIEKINKARNKVLYDSAENTFGAMAEMAKTFAGETSGVYKTLFAIEKSFAIGRSVMAIQQGLALASANPWPTNLGAIASVAGATASIVGAIEGVRLTGMAHDGIDRIPETGTWLLEKGERVLTKNTAEKLDGKLEQLNDGVSNINISLIECPDKAGKIEQRKESNQTIIDIFVSDLLGDGKTAKALNRKYSLNTIGR